MNTITNRLIQALKDSDYADIIALGCSAKLKVNYNQSASTLKFKRNLYQTLRSKRIKKFVKKVYVKQRKNEVEITIILRTKP